MRALLGDRRGHVDMDQRRPRTRFSSGRRDGLATALAILLLGCRSVPNPPATSASVSVATAAIPTDTADAGAPPPSREPDGTVHSTLAYWHCVGPGCSKAASGGAVISWPEWAAHQGNGGREKAAREVFSAGGRPLYPYMGRWANGCELTVVSGYVEVLALKRGGETTRSIRLRPGDKHVITLRPPEDSAIIEAAGGTPAFSVSLKHCTPKPLP